MKNFIQKQCFIIAEAGINHNGSLENALRLVDIAKDAGADAVKFQTFISEEVIVPYAQKANYQITNTQSSESQLEMVKKLELSFDDFKKIKKYCDEKNIIFFSTPFDLPSIQFLIELGVPMIKIPSGELTNLQLIDKVVASHLPIILSTGMATLEEIECTVSWIKKDGFYHRGNLFVLQCNTAYPTPAQDVNLLAMTTIKNHLQLDIGYSDHTLGNTAAIAAVALGAKIIEKHFTLDKNMVGPDHLASLNPQELKQFVSLIRDTEKMLGDGIKKPSASEVENISIARKSIVAKKKILAGDVFTWENITTKRPGTGLSPMNWFSVLGKKSPKEFNENEMIEV